MPIASLHFTEVGPFEDISFDFDNQVNVFTGPNNSGKSTVLWVLGELLAFPFSLNSRLLRSDETEWTVTFQNSAGAMQELEGSFPSDFRTTSDLIDAMGYTCFIPAQRQATGLRPKGPSVGEDIESRLDQEVEHLLRERPTLSSLIGVEEIRRRMRASRGELSPHLQKRGQLLLSGGSSVSDEPVLQKIVDLDYASLRTNNQEIKEAIHKVFSLATEITQGFPMSFEGIVQDSMEGNLYLKLGTPHGTMPLDVLSQGTQSLIQCLARFVLGYAEFYEFPQDLQEKPGVLIIDEIDAHLHPSWQRRIIPTLTKHFPNIQIICSTHSPLLLAGQREGQVQLLRFDSDGQVSVSTNSEDIVGWSADEILRDFLEVPNPTDWETVRNLERLNELRSKVALTSDESKEMETLQAIISRDLLSGPVSGLLDRFAEEIRQGRGEN